MNLSEAADTLEEALNFAESLGGEFQFARAVLEGGEWIIALCEIESFEDQEFQRNFGQRLRDVREFFGDPVNPLV